MSRKLTLLFILIALLFLACDDSPAPKKCRTVRVDCPGIANDIKICDNCYISSHNRHSNHYQVTFCANNATASGFYQEGCTLK